MNDKPLHIWDGKRPLLPRHVMARTKVQIGHLGIIAATEDLSQATDWAFEEHHHTIVVHLGGRLAQMDCEFSKGPSGAALPSRGDVWMIPAGCRYAALAKGGTAQFVEFNVPTALLGDAQLEARVQHRDGFIFAAADRLYELVSQTDDDVARLASHAIANALQLHLVQRYGSRLGSNRKWTLNANDRAVILDAIRSQLGDRITLEMLAARIGMEVRPFTSAFKAAFGLSPWQYVLRERLDEAARRLRDTKATVTDIALIVGFATPSHFATAFTHYFGVPPTRYRRGFRG